MAVTQETLTACLIPSSTCSRAPSTSWSCRHSSPWAQQHGYGIARRIEQISGDTILLNQGTIYASLVRLQNRGWITAEWGTSDNNRKAKYYAITRSGRKQLARDAADWRRLSDVMGRVLAQSPEGAE